VPCRQVRSLRCLRQVGFVVDRAEESVRLGGSTVPAPSRICWKVERQLSFSRRHGQLSGLSGSLSSRGLETSGTPGGGGNGARLSVSR